MPTRSPLPLLCLATVLSAQAPSTTTEAMAKLSFMRGTWVGEASGVAMDGSRYKVTQTERMGPLLGGDIILVEGRGYKADGSTGFNAFGVVSYSAQTKTYEFRSYAMGYAGTFTLTPTAGGYTWDIPIGPGVIRYTATVKDGVWHEVGDRIFPGAAPVRTFEMTLKRTGDTDWPGANPVAFTAK
ncbi:hypothetical protein [Geothrix sp. PMB-07]|uniref:hypothetical protein n=1 Tax=Geothrix sp. PMB-07 TaxID=3068640 RepID=UPI0027420B7D|nr:hypothetical protein [Geothrix sp. PMB-07]WLT31231.1 hypothetical protein Q9293_16060 [Geothrix sp. PMB-07]